MIVPATWIQTLRKVQTQFPEAVILGGCLRDLQLGKPVKDVDIFVCDRDQTFENCDIAMKVAMQPTDVGAISLKDAASEAGTTAVSGVWQFQVRMHQIPYEVICVKGTYDDETFLERTDFGICRIIHNGRELIRHADFYKDMNNKEFTLVNARERQTSLARFERLKEKFPDWTVVAPDDFDFQP